MKGNVCYNAKTGELVCGRNVLLTIVNGVITPGQGAGGNTPPVLDPTTNLTNMVGNVINASFPATDADGDTLTWSATGLPPGLTIDPATGVVSGSPTTDGAYNVAITVDDGNGGTDTMTFLWTITAVANNPPVLDPIADQTNTTGDVVNVAAPAADGDGDTLTWSAAGLPPGVTINPATGAMTGSPTTAGVFNVTVTVDDGNGGADTATFTWTVSAIAPALAVTKTPSVATANVGDTVTYTIAVTNNGGSPATNVAVADAIPAAMAYDVGTITGTGADDSGAPTLAWTIPAIAAGATETLTYQVTAVGGVDPYDLNLLGDPDAGTTEISGAWIYTPSDDVTVSTISQLQTISLFSPTVTRRLLLKTGGINGTIVGASDDLTYAAAGGVQTYPFSAPVALTAGTSYHVVFADTSNTTIAPIGGDALARTTGPSDTNNEVLENGAGAPDKVVVRVEGTTPSVLTMLATNTASASSPDDPASPVAATIEVQVAP